MIDSLVFLAILFPVLIILSLAIYIFGSIFLGLIFKKAGVPAWKAWVPVYNNWITLELGDQKGYWAVLAFIPIVNLVSSVFMYISFYHIGKKLGKTGEFFILAFFLPVVWLIWLAVDRSTWQSAPRTDTQPGGNEPPTFAPPQSPTSL